jgi:hypothetical protein
MKRTRDHGPTTFSDIEQLRIDLQDDCGVDELSADLNEARRFIDE